MPLGRSSSEPVSPVSRDSRDVTWTPSMSKGPPDTDSNACDRTRRCRAGCISESLLREMDRPPAISSTASGHISATRDSMKERSRAAESARRRSASENLGLDSLSMGSSSRRMRFLSVSGMRLVWSMRGSRPKTLQ